MTANDHSKPSGTRREAATRRAAFVWMLAYAAVIVAIAAAHMFGGVSGTLIDAHGLRPQQAKVSAAPQSSLAGSIVPVSLDGRDG
ncbi:MAG: hypothetical protein J0H54_08280 [Rhizobiales bacterium]|nr:hypothetical protein [Hyphomicrobiales bacterium]